MFVAHFGQHVTSTSGSEQSHVRAWHVVTPSMQWHVWHVRSVSGQLEPCGCTSSPIVQSAETKVKSMNWSRPVRDTGDWRVKSGMKRPMA